MAELVRAHPLEAWSASFATLPASLRVTVDPYVAMVDVRLPSVDGVVDGAVDDRASARLGVHLPSVPNTWVPTHDGGAVWLGPDEWLLASTTEQPEKLEFRVREAVVPLGGSATDVSAQRIVVRLSGTRARDLLARGCSIDLHPRVFGAGRSVQTTLGLAGVVLLTLTDTGDDYLILVRSSFAGYLADWLVDAAVELDR